MSMSVDFCNDTASPASDPPSMLLANALRLSPPQQRALLHIGRHGALQRFPRGFGRRCDAVADFITEVTARAMVAADLIRLSPFPGSSQISLTVRGRKYAAALALTVAG